jgi:ABC-2 type transport system permease protein
MDMILRTGRKAVIAYKGLFGVMNWKSYLLVNILNPIMQLIFFSLVASYVYGTENLSPWIIGNALVIAYFNAFFGIGVQLSSEKAIGTLKLLIASPSSRLGIFFPRAILHCIDGLGSILLGFLVGYLVFGFRLPVNQWASFLLVLLVASFSAMAFGLIIACCGLITRDLNLLLNLASMSLLTLTGANFSLTLLPIWLQPVAYALPLTRSIELCRLLQKGASLSSHMTLLYGELAMGLVFCIIGFVMFSVMERIAIKHGTLELF